LLSEFADNDEVKKIKSDYEALLTIYKEPSDEKQIDNAFLTRLASGLEKARQNIVE
jgi:GTP1/Obg family GTP-binding protein